MIDIDKPFADEVTRVVRALRREVDEVAHVHGWKCEGYCPVCLAVMRVRAELLGLVLAARGADTHGSKS